MPVNQHEILLPTRVAEFAALLAAGAIPAGEVLFDIRSGEDYIGLTELEATGAGECRLKSSQTKGNLLVWHTAKVSVQLAGDLIRSFHDHQVWNLPSTRPGIPGERGIRIVLRYRSRLWVKTFWLGEISADKHWASFHGTVQKIVHSLGRGKVLDWAN